MPAHSPQRVDGERFTSDDHQTWGMLYSGLEVCRQEMTVPEFTEGLKTLHITGEKIPDLNQVNATLGRLTGWSGVPVIGLEESAAFYPMLADRTYPIGWFVRDRLDLSYTPAPDVFHDLYGHLPFFADEAFADFCADFGRRACRYLDQPEIMNQFDRFFWFTVEFGLIKTPQGNRIFGGGILSSRGESDYALGPTPKVVPFDLNRIRSQHYRVDVYQETLFLIPDRVTLYESLDRFETLIRES